VLFVAWGTYLLVAGVTLFLSPRLLSNTVLNVHLRYGLKLGGTYITMTAGALWVLVGWSLFFRPRWARCVAALLCMYALSAGFASALIFGDKSSLTALWWGQMVASVVVWYLLRKQTRDYFQRPIA